MDILVEYSPSQSENLRKAYNDYGIWACWYWDVEEILPIRNNGYPDCYIKCRSAARITRLNKGSITLNQPSDLVYGKGTKVTFMYNGHEEQRLLFNDSDVLAMSNMVNFAVLLESI